VIPAESGYSVLSMGGAGGKSGSRLPAAVGPNAANLPATQHGVLFAILELFNVNVLPEIIASIDVLHRRSPFHPFRSDTPDGHETLREETGRRIHRTG